MGKSKSKRKVTKTPIIISSPLRNVSFSSAGTSTHYQSVPTRSDTEAPVRSKPLVKKRRSSDGSDELERKPSPVMAPLSILDAEEYEFFSMVKAGDTLGLLNAIWSCSIKKININRFNKHGYTVLHVAIRRQDEEMVRILLQNTTIRLNDTLLHAIREDNLQITKQLLEVYDRLVKQEGAQQLVAKLSTQNLEDINKIVNNSAAMNDGANIIAWPTSNRSGVRTSVKLASSRSRSPTLQQQPSAPPLLTPSQSQRSNQLSNSNSSGSSSSPTPEKENAVNVKAALSKIKDDIPFDSEFHQVITPLMLAAQVGSTQLMELFYSRGERLESPELHHNMGCECEICKSLDPNSTDDMSRVHQCYHLFKALSQPEYICFMAMKAKVDPVNYAIDKIIKIRDIVQTDVAYDQMYEKFIEQLETFCMDMLARCRTSRETEVFMSRKDTEEKERLPHEHPRLWYTVGLGMKSFVAHPNTQNIVYKYWATDDWPDWDTYGPIHRIFNLAIRVIAFPLIALILFVGQDSKMAKNLGSPLGRFLNYMGSYILFLGLVTFQVVTPFQRCNDVVSFQVNDDTCKKRGPPNMGTEWVLVAYILGYCVSMLKRQSVSWYWSRNWNFYEACFVLSFICTFVCWGLAWIWTQVPENEPFISATNRLFWNPYSPEILGECFLSISTMLAYGRLLRFLQLFPGIGPLQVGVGKQITAFVSTAMMYMLIIFAFGCALLALYVPYNEYMGIDGRKNPKKQDSTYSTPETLFEDLFWYFQMPNPRGALLTWDIKINETTVEEVHHYYTQFFGKLIVCSFHIICFIMMHSMLIGYFASTMQQVMKDADRVWKFSRTELYLTHIKDTALPPPFNLIPPLKTIGNALKYLTLIGKTEDPRAACSFKQCCYITDSIKISKWRRKNDEYRRLILELILRYLKFRKDSFDKEKASRDDALETKEEITEIKEMIRYLAGVGPKPDSPDDSFEDFPPRGPPPPSPGVVASRTRSADPFQDDDDEDDDDGGGAPGRSASNPVITTQPHHRKTPYPRGISQDGRNQSINSNPNPTIKLSRPSAANNQIGSLNIKPALLAAPSATTIVSLTAPATPKKITSAATRAHQIQITSPTQVIPEYAQTSTTNYYTNPPPENLPRNFGSVEYSVNNPSLENVQTTTYGKPLKSFAEPNSKGNANQNEKVQRSSMDKAFVGLTPPRQVGLIGSPPPPANDVNQNRSFVERHQVDPSLYSPWNLDEEEEKVGGLNDSPLQSPTTSLGHNYIKSPPGFNFSADIRKKEKGGENSKGKEMQSHFTNDGSPPPTPTKASGRTILGVRPLGSFGSDGAASPPQSTIAPSETELVPLEHPSAGLQSEGMVGDNPFGYAGFSPSKIVNLSKHLALETIKFPSTPGKPSPTTQARLSSLDDDVLPKLPSPPQSPIVSTPVISPMPPRNVLSAAVAQPSTPPPNSSSRRKFLDLNLTSKPSPPPPLQNKTPPPPPPLPQISTPPLPSPPQNWNTPPLPPPPQNLKTPPLPSPPQNWNTPPLPSPPQNWNTPPLPPPPSPPQNSTPKTPRFEPPPPLARTPSRTSINNNNDSGNSGPNFWDNFMSPEAETIGRKGRYSDTTPLPNISQVGSNLHSKGRSSKDNTKRNS